MPPKPLSDDPDDMPVKLARDEIEQIVIKEPPIPAATTVVVETVAPRVDVGSDDFRLKLEELRFKLEEKKELHRMALEMRHEDQKEDQISYERRLEQAEAKKKEDKEGEHWMKAYWRPAMGWLYMLINLFDFVIAPMLAMAMPLFLKSLGATTVTYTQWQSLTLQNGGLIHLAFGAILGVTAWTRGQEKAAKAQTQG
jgi:hypothetical protein